MASIQRFEDIEARKMARALTNRIYDVTAKSESNRDYGLRDQIRRASISIVSNIAEGYERDGDKEFLQFLFIAKGSCGEVRAQLYLAHDRAYISDEEFSELTHEQIGTTESRYLRIDKVSSSVSTNRKEIQSSYKPGSEF